jgi:hypothetical protein
LSPIGWCTGGELRGWSPSRDGHRVNLKKQFLHRRLEEDHGDCPFYYRRGRLAWQVLGG